MNHLLRRLFSAAKKALTKRPATRLDRRARLGVGSLEERALMTTTLFVDFGDAFPAAGLNMKVSELATTLHGPNLAASDNPVTKATGGLYQNEDTLTFTPLNSLVTFDFNGDGTPGN